MSPHSHLPHSRLCNPQWPQHPWNVVFRRVGSALQLPFLKPLTSPQRRAAWVVERVALGDDTQHAMRMLRGRVSFGLLGFSPSNQYIEALRTEELPDFYLSRSNPCIRQGHCAYLEGELAPRGSGDHISYFDRAQGRGSASEQVGYCYSSEPLGFESVCLEGPELTSGAGVMFPAGLSPALCSRGRSSSHSHDGCCPIEGKSLLVCPAFPQVQMLLYLEA